MTLSEKLEFFPRSDLQSFRARFEATLSYFLWQQFSLHLTLAEIFDSDPASDVPKNELQIRSSLGVIF